MKGFGLPSLGEAAWVGRLAPLMSPAQAAPGLLLYFVDPTAPPTRPGGALAVPSLREGQGMGTGVSRRPFPFHHPRGVRGGEVGRMAERGKGGGMGAAHDGGHERSHAPRLSEPFNAAPTHPSNHCSPRHQHLKEFLT